jgi:hypothetical protein
LSPNGWLVPTPESVFEIGNASGFGNAWSSNPKATGDPGDLGAPTLGKMQAMSRTWSKVRAIPAREGPPIHMNGTDKNWLVAAKRS